MLTPATSASIPNDKSFVLFSHHELFPRTSKLLKQTAVSPLALDDQNVWDDKGPAPTGCSKIPSGKAAASEEAMRTLFGTWSL